MPTLEEQIDDLRRQYPVHEKFVPYKSLSELLTEEVIRTTVLESSIERHAVEDVIKRISNGGKRILAILIAMDQMELVINFIKHDDFQNVDLDYKLPIGLADLEKIFGIVEIDKQMKEHNTDQTIKDPQKEQERRDLDKRKSKISRWARQFDEKQYEYIVPMFLRKSPHRILSDPMRLPFIEEKHIAEGGYGNVDQVTLPAQLHGSGSTDLTLVRKELKKKDKFVNQAFEAELRCLSILRLIEHPNILELYCSYTHRGRHYLLFPLAGGDLQDFLSRDERPVQLKSDESVFFALCGLSSALESVHSYTYKSLELELIGCHHDLKPKNILVDGARFILADFGLSQLHNAADSSKTIFKSGEGFYIAPECEDLETFRTFPIGRRSDIWSFGCILAVLLTFLKLGTRGLKSFEESRRFTVAASGSTFYTFHQGRAAPNESVTKKLSELDSIGSNEDQYLTKLATKLVRHTLSIEPEGRPSMKEISGRLRFIALRTRCQSINEIFPHIDHQGKLEFDIERLTFETWLWSIDQIEDATEHIVQNESTFLQVCSTLEEFRRELRRLSDTREDLHPLFVKLRQLNENLLSYLLADVRKRVSSLIEFKMLNSEHSTVMNDIAKEGSTLAGMATNSRILILSSIKYMRTLTSELPDSSIKLDQEDICIVRDWKTFMVGKLRIPDSDVEDDIIVEWLTYDGTWQDEQVGKKLFNRMENLLHLSQQKTDEFRTLPCRGFCHKSTQHGFALVYRFPLGPQNQTVTPLIDLLTNTEPVDYRKKWMISLKDRLRLAYELAGSVFEFHKVGWLHKSISSFNVVFFTVEPGQSMLLKSPYLIGFSHSRPDQVGEISLGVTEQSKILNDYQHPEYREVPTGQASKGTGSYTRYRTEFDYYSLGLVLLEIGLWKPLEKLRTQDRVSPASVTQHLVERRVPYLAGHVGETYRDAVKACLTESLWRSGEGKNLDAKQVNMNFEHLVIGRLATCLFEG